MTVLNVLSTGYYPRCLSRRISGSFRPVVKTRDGRRSVGKTHLVVGRRVKNAAKTKARRAKIRTRFRRGA